MTRERVLPWLAIGCAVLGLGASAASLVDALGPTPAFCAEGGCATVRASGWARPFGVPLAALGLPFFAVTLLLTLGGARLTRARQLGAALGGVGALGLLVIQGAVIGAWCPLCLIADSAALGLAVATLGGGAWTAASGRGRVVAAVLAVAAVAAPLTGLRDGATAAPTITHAGALPDVVAREQTPGHVTVVDFVDFECPFCRALHARLTAALAQVAAERPAPAIGAAATVDDLVAALRAAT